MKIILLLCFLGLGACSGGGGRVEVSGSAGVGRLGYVAPVLTQAKADFLGGFDLGGGTGGVDADGGFNIDYEGNPAVAIMVASVRERDLGSGSRLQLRAYGEYGQVAAFLPKGLVVLTDPLQIDIGALGVGGDVAVGRALRLPGGQRFDYAAGLGVERTAARVHLRSALIERWSRSFQTTPYLLALGQYLPLRGPTVAGELRVFDLGEAEVRLGVVQAF